MKWKITKEEFDKLSQPIQELYKLGGDGNYHLQAEEDPDAAAKLKEFRDNNTKLLKELKEVRDQYKDVDPAKYKEYQEKIQKLEDKKLMDAGEIDKLVEQKTERMKTAYENQLTEMRTALETKDKEIIKTKGHLSSVLIDSEITRAVAGKVRKGAMDDILARGRRTWSLDENGKPIPKEGDKVLYGKDGKAAMTFDEWAVVQMETAPFLFESSAGSGGQGNNGAQSHQGPLSREEVAKLPPSERLNMAHAQTKK
jgi:hypothetical protein